MKDESASVHPSSFIPQPSEEDDDALPAVGKVWDNSGPSLSEMLKQRRTDPEPPSTPAPASTDSNVEPVSITDLPHMWQALLDNLAARGPSLHSIVAHGKLTCIEDGRAVIRYEKKHETFVKMLDRNGKRDVVRDALSKVAGEPLGVLFEVDETQAEAEFAVAEAPPPPRTPVRKEPVRVNLEPPSAPPANVVRITPELIESLRSSEPLIKQLMDELGATIVKVEPPENQKV